MKKLLSIPGLIFLAALASCATGDRYDPLDDYVEHKPTTNLNAPAPGEGDYNPTLVSRGKYMVELLGCGSCHTHGALVGVPETGLSLAGSRIGIAYTSPLVHANPGVVFPPNITPDRKTGVGQWDIEQISDAIRRGKNSHGERLNPVMPWWGYRTMSDDDALAIASYLKSIPPVSRRVPRKVQPGERTNESFVYFGVYEER